MGEGDHTPHMARHTVTEAADILGISTGALRNRLSRGTLASVKEDGTVYVLLPDDMSRGAERDTNDTHAGMSQSASGALISQMQERIDSLERQLEAEREANSEQRRLLLRALERIPPQLEAPGSSEPVEEAPEGAEPPSGTEGARVDAQEPQSEARRPWWRRVFGS